MKYSMWVLCTVEYVWSEACYRSVAELGRPLQVFSSECEAEAARELLNPHYNFDLEVYSQEEFSEAQ